MADKSFTGIVLQNSYWSTEDGTNEYTFITNIHNAIIYYQGYYYSTDPATRPHKWSPVYTTGFRGEIDCNVNDPDWLDTAMVASGDKVVFVFWEIAAGADRTDPAVYFGRRGWLEITLTSSSTYPIYPLLALTSLTSTYDSNMPPRYGELDFDYDFEYSSVLNETYTCNNMFFYNQITGNYQNTEQNKTMSHESSVYGENMFDTVSGIRETLTFTDDDTQIQRTQSPVTTNFTHSFSIYTRSKLVRTLEYLIGGVYYEDTLYPDVIRQDQIIANYFIELVVKDPAIYDINIYRDRDFKLKILTDLVDYFTYKARIKETPSSATVLAEFDITINEIDEYIELTLSSETTRELIDDVVLSLSSSDTKRKLAWDLKITNPVHRTFNLIQGDCYVYRTVSRSTT